MLSPTEIEEEPPEMGEELVVEAQVIAERLADEVRAIAGRLDRLAQDAVSRKILVEERWYDDLRQYYGRYDDAKEAELKREGKTRVFARTTRAKTDTWEARLFDLLFPTDAKNWGIKPTPIPELQRPISQLPADDERAIAARQVLDEAKQKCEAMEKLIDDQLTECRYSAVARDAIHDAFLLGTGIIEGPVVADDVRRMWGPIDDGTYAMLEIEEQRPGFERIDPWSFFPDPSARTIAEAEYAFVRYLPNAKQLRQWAKRPGFDKEAIRRLLNSKPREAVPNYLNTVRTITIGATTGSDTRYTVWKYVGSLAAEDLTALGDAMGRPQFGQMVADVDPLEDVQVVLWFCDGEVLKLGIHPLDRGTPLFSVFNFVADETSVWGFGVPAMMRDSQAALNAAWRMMLDNGGLSTGPQIVVNRQMIEPANGSWTIEPRKIWWAKNDVASAVGLKAAFELYNIDSRQQELLNIVETAIRFSDEEVSLPVIAQGEQGGHTTTTANGMAMLMNSANVIFRRAVRNFDDGVTVPVISNLYEWNMQNSDDPEVKGDFRVNAQGSAVLLVREIQAQNLMQMAAQFGGHPVFGLLIKPAQLLRKIAQAHMVDADEIIKTDEEIEADAQRQQEAAATGQPADDGRAAAAQAKAQSDMEIAKLESDVRMQIAQMEYQGALARLAAEQQMTVAELQTKLQLQNVQQQHDERIFAAEVGFKDRQRQIADARPPNEKPDTGAGTRFAP